jgi:flavin reductase (DIM6/NTAB) family NADH-FMN oxidoreductase RutF
VAADDLRALLRNVPAPVSVVTVDVEGERLGLTVASLLLLSLEPPLLGVAVSRQAALHELLRQAESFGISLLAGDQERLAGHFARGVPPIGLWEGISTRPGASGAPLVEDAFGWIECRLRDEHATGDHTFFVGDVIAAQLGEPSEPLLYVRQGYTSL